MSVSQEDHTGRATQLAALPRHDAVRLVVGSVPAAGRAERPRNLVEPLLSVSGSEVELHPVAPAMTTWLAAPAGVILCSLQLLPDRSYRPNNGTGQTDRDS